MTKPEQLEDRGGLNPVTAVERFLWQLEPDGTLRWQPEAAEMIALLAGCLEKPETLLHRLLEIHQSNADAFSTMLVLAAYCLAEADPSKVDASLAQTITTEFGPAWKQQGFPEDLVSSLPRQWRVQWLHQALRDNDHRVREKAAEVLVGLGDKSAVEPLVHCLQDQTPKVRETVMRALGELGDLRAVGPLIQTLREDHDDGLRSSAALSLGQFGDAVVIPALVQAMWKDRSATVREHAAVALGGLIGAGFEQEVRQRLADLHRVERGLLEVMRVWSEPGQKIPDEDLLHLKQALGDEMEAGDGHSDVATVESLIQALQDHKSQAREEAAEELGLRGDRSAVAPLIQALQADEASEVRRHVANALGRLGDTRAVAPLIRALRVDDDPLVRSSAADAMRLLGDVRAVQPLVQALHEDKRELVGVVVRFAAARALGDLGDADAVQPLFQALSDDDLHVRNGVATALQKLRQLHPRWFRPLRPFKIVPEEHQVEQA